MKLFRIRRWNAKFIIVVVGILDIVLCFIVAAAWRKKDLSYAKGFWYSFFFSPIIGMLLGILEVMSSSGSPLGSKTCPQCGEYVKSEASVCKFCGYKFEVNYLQLAERYEEKEMIPKAISMYEQYLKINPNDPDAHNSLGVLYDKEKNYKKAIEAYKKALEIKPDYAVGYYNLGFAYKSLGESKRAIEAYERYKKLNPKANDIPEIEEEIQLLREELNRGK